MKRIRQPWWLLAAMFPLTVSPARAGEQGVTGPAPSTEPLVISWPDLVSRVERQPEVAASNHRIAAARASVDAAGAVPNPSLQAIAAYGRARDTDASRVEWGVGLTFPLGWTGTRRAGQAAARGEQQVREAEAATLRRHILEELSALFWQLVYQQLRVSALRELDLENRRLAATVGLRVEKGDVRPVEGIRMTVEVEKIAGELEMAESTLVALQQRLGLRLGLPSGRPVLAEADLSRLPEPPPLEGVMACVRRDHPVVAEAQATARSLENDVGVERKKRSPTMAVELFTDQELDRMAYGAGLDVELPLWSRRQGEIRRAEALASAGKMASEAEVLRLEDETVAVHQACRAGVILARRYASRVLPPAETAAETIRRTYELGEVSLIEVIDARRTLLEIRQEHDEAVARAHAECRRLALLMGEEVR